MLVLSHCQALWSIDGVPKAVYPLIFLQEAAFGRRRAHRDHTSSGSEAAAEALQLRGAALVADVDTFEAAVECAALPPAVLADHGIIAFDQLFEGVLPTGSRRLLLMARQRLLLALGSLCSRTARASPLCQLSPDLLSMIASVDCGSCQQLPTDSSGPQSLIWR